MSQTFSFELDMDKSRRSPQMVAARVGDMGSIHINASLVNNGSAYTPTGKNAYFECITNADTSVRVNAQLSGSTVSVDIPSQALCKPGIITCAYFRFENGTTDNPTFVESTQSFGIIVPTSIDDNIDAEDYLGEWRQLEQQLQGYVDEVSQAAAQAKQDISADASSVDSAKSSAISEINADKQEVADAAADAMKPINDALDQFEEDSQGAINAFNTKGTSAIGTFNTNGTNAISQFNTKGNNAVSTFNSQGTQKIQEFDDAADTKLDSVDSMISQAQADVNADIAALEKATQEAIDAMEAALSEDQYGELLQRLSRVWKLSSQDMTVITQSQDLNTLTAVGTYVCDTNAKVNTLVNKPEGLDMAFALFVMHYSTSPLLVQFAIPYLPSTGDKNVKLWLRSKESAGAFSQWCPVGSGADILAGIGINVSGSGDSKEVSVDPGAFHELKEGVELASFDTSVTGGGSVQDMVVYGKTVQNLWVNPSGTANGVTFTPNASGSVTISGSPTGSNNRANSENIYVLKPNTQYTISIDRALGSNSYVMLVGYDVDGDQVPSTAAVVTLTRDETFETFTVPSDVVSCTCSMQVNLNGTASGTYRIMLNEGSTAEPWCPPGLSSIDEVELVTAGKNLLVPVGGAVDGVTYEVTEDGGVKVTGNSGDATSVKFLSVAGAPADGYWGSDDGLHRKLSPGNYFLSGSDGVVKIYCNIYYSDGSIIDARDTGSGCSFEIKDGYIGLNARLVCPVGEEMDTTVYPQLELGSTATAFEPSHQVTVTTIDLDGHSLRSLPDGTCDELNIDANGKATLIKRVESVFIDSDEDWTIRSDTSDFNANGNDAYNSQRISATFGNSYDNIFCDTYAISIVSNPSMPRNTVRKDYAGNYIICVVEQGTSPNDCTVLYSLATPQTIQLGKISLPGIDSSQVNVWANGVADSTRFSIGPDIDVNLNKVDYKVQDVDLSGKEDAFDILSVSKGGTGVTSAAAERNRLGLGNTTAALPIANGGTGSTSAASARTALGITPANIGAAPASHTHTASQVSGLGTASAKNISLQSTVRDRVAYVGADGVMEIGSMIDFHLNDGDSKDYDMRMSVSSSNTKFSKPVDIASGGTGATSGSSAFSSLASELSTLDSGGIASVIANASGGGYFKYTPKALAAALQQYISAGGDIDASDITSGVLAVARGGTGVTSAQAERNRLGLGNTTGALPVANGGTGATSASNAANTILGGVTSTTMTLGSTAEFFIDDDGVPSRLGYLTMVSDIGARLLGNSESNAQIKFLTVENVGGTLAGVASNVYNFIYDCDNDGNEFLCLAKFTATIAGLSFNVGLVGRLEKDLSNGGPTIYMSGIGWPTLADSTSDSNAGLLLVHAFTNVTSSSMSFNSSSLYFLGIKASSSGSNWPPSSPYNIYGSRYNSSNFSFNRMLLLGYDSKMVA